MNKIYKFIDRILIDEYANKQNYTLDIDSLPKSEINNLLDLLMNDDTHVRDWVLHAMQKLIDERLEDKERSERYDRGLRTRRDPINGEVIIGGAA